MAGDAVPVVGITYHDYGKDHPELVKSSPGLVGERPRCLCLRGDFGFLVTWDDKTPPEFHIYEKKPARSECLLSFEALLDWIKNVPEGAKISWINACTAGTCWSMPGDKKEQLYKVWKPNAPSEKDDAANESFCTCESERLTYFKSLQEGRQWIREHKGCKDAYTDKPIVAEESK